MAESPPIVLDVGSAYLRCGFAATNHFVSSFPSVVGRLAAISSPTRSGQAHPTEAGIVGAEALHQRLPYIYNAISHGEISNFKAMEEILAHSFRHSLHVEPSAQHLLMSESCLLRDSEREALAELVFEHFGALGFYLANSAVLTLLAYGSLSGVVLECGNQFTSASPVFEGHLIRGGVSVQPVCGGEQLDRYLASLLVARGCKSMKWSENQLLLRQAKETLCYVAQQPSSEVATELQFDLPNSSKLTLGKERFQVPELLFDPSPLGSASNGIVSTLENAIFNPKNVDRELQPLLCSNIAVGGGTSLLAGFLERLRWEIFTHLPHKLNPNLLDCPSQIRRDHLVWTGGSILASMPHFPQLAISREEYAEFGSVIVDLKCL